MVQDLHVYTKQKKKTSKKVQTFIIDRIGYLMFV